jgi:mRNA interferase MazF
MNAREYCPCRGDIVWIRFNPQAGHEQAGLRPAFILSPEAYNRKVGLAILCPITSQVKGFPFEVPIPEGLDATGVVLSDQVKSMDWRARNARFICKAPVATVKDVLNRLGTLLDV